MPTDAEIQAIMSGAYWPLALGLIGSSVTPTYADASDVRDGVDRGDGTPGTLDLPAVADVREGVTFDGATKTGLIDLPAVADVRSGVAFDNSTKTGSAAIPTATDVRAGVAVDATTGNLILPTESQVLDGVGYGSNGTEAEGNVTLPAATDVLDGVAFGAADALTGTLASPVAPGLSVVNDGTGTSVTATITGAAGLTVRLYYKTLIESAWVAGETRVGPGTIQQSGLSEGVYLFVAVAINSGLVSLPSQAVRLAVSATGVEDVTPAMVVRELLVAAEYFTLPSEKEDWPLFVTFLPDGDEVPTDCGAVYDTTGVRDARILDTGENLFRFGFQVRLRGSDYTALWRRAGAISDFLASVQNVDVQMGAEWWTVHDVSITTPPISLGLEPGVKKRRHLFTVNGIVALSRKE